MTKTYTSLHYTEIAAIIRSASEWDYDLLAALCMKAGLADEWEAADGETFEEVANQAAEILGVEIY